MTATHQFKVVSAFLIIYFVWGSTYLAIRLTLDAVPAFFSMGLRFFIAAVLIFIWIKPGKIRQVTLKQAINSLAVGFMLMGLGTGPVAWAVRYVPTGVTAMIIAVLPVWFVLFEKLLKNRAELGVVSCVGIGISIAGSLLLMGITDINAF
ncbi:MAG: EamA family transporter, partial [Proteobacteria bacterium]|nr:EamA family transporter [Pseudomonadota bacterium]